MNSGTPMNFFCLAIICHHHAINNVGHFNFSYNLHVGRAKYDIMSVQKCKIIANRDHMSTCNYSQSTAQMESCY